MSYNSLHIPDHASAGSSPMLRPAEMELLAVRRRKESQASTASSPRATPEHLASAGNLSSVSALAQEQRRVRQYDLEHAETLELLQQETLRLAEFLRMKSQSRQQAMDGYEQDVEELTARRDKAVDMLAGMELHVCEVRDAAAVHGVETIATVEACAASADKVLTELGREHERRLAMARDMARHEAEHAAAVEEMKATLAEREKEIRGALEAAAERRDELKARVRKAKLDTKTMNDATARTLEELKVAAEAVAEYKELQVVVSGYKEKQAADRAFINGATERQDAHMNTIQDLLTEIGSMPSELDAERLTLEAQEAEAAVRGRIAEAQQQLNDTEAELDRLTKLPEVVTFSEHMEKLRLRVLASGLGPAEEAALLEMLRDIRALGDGSSTEQWRSLAGRLTAARRASTARHKAQVKAKREAAEAARAELTGSPTGSALRSYQRTPVESPERCWCRMCGFGPCVAPQTSCSECGAVLDYGKALDVVRQQQTMRWLRGRIDAASRRQRLLTDLEVVLQKPPAAGSPHPETMGPPPQQQRPSPAVDPWWRRGAPPQPPVVDARQSALNVAAQSAPAR